MWYSVILRGALVCVWLAFTAWAVVDTWKGRKLPLPAGVSSGAVTGSGAGAVTGSGAVTVPFSYKVAVSKI